MSIAEYYDGMDEIRKDSGNPDVFKISPSSVADFFTSTSQYYKEQVLGEEKAFKGSTATHLGTIVHFCAEVSANGGDTTELENDVEMFLNSLTDENVNKEEIKSLWFDMAALLVENTVLDEEREIVGTEEFMYNKLNDHVYVGGTYDALIKDKADYAGNGLCVVDYKTASTKPSGINWKYRLQAYTYCWMLRERGKNITALELCFVTRPTKTLPVRYFNFKESYTNENHIYIGNVLKLIAESVALFKKEPTLRHIIAQDLSLKQEPKPRGFPARV